ncbi:MAG TPA: DUF393 domain-containing protein [Acidimicrobiales bacterium]|nr:DUF393 domain-containing protein [Acidimicrobiales bacterium]
MPPLGADTLVFDGDCGFCSAVARWVRRKAGGRARVVAWQELGPEGLATLGLTEADARQSAWWISASGPRHGGAQAMARALVASGGLWSVAGGAMTVPPLRWIAPYGYRAVARLRHLLPGATTACRL